MATHTYDVPEGGTVLKQFVGTKITLNEPDTIEQAVPKYFASPAALLASALRDRRIMANRAVRKVLSTDKGTQAEAILKGNAVVVGAPRPASERKPKTPQAQARATAQTVGNAMMEKAISDPKAAKLAIENGFTTAEAIEAYRTAKAAPKPERKAKVATPETPVAAPASPANTGGKNQPAGAKRSGK